MSGSKSSLRRAGALAAALSSCALWSCAPSSPQTGSQTHWLSVCETSDECGEFECICGTCTASCADDALCEARGLGSCRARTDASSVAVCDGQAPGGGMCLASCDEGSCPQGSKCVADVCVAAPDETLEIEVDTATRHQSLVGFGASLAYDEDAIAAHPAEAELLDALFLDAGLDVVRLRNRFEGDDAALDSAVEIVGEASARLGHGPVLFLTSSGPPAALKANGERFCTNSDPDCTLVRDAGGAFDYAGFAEHWRSSLEAHEAAGLHPDYVSLQSHPDWLPPADVAIEACQFLPVEGTATLTTPDGPVEAEFPGYLEALEAVRAAAASVGDYVFAAPEVGSPDKVKEFTDVLPASAFESLALQFYTTDPAAIDTEALEGLGSLAATANKSLLQSEMQEGGLGTAVLIHAALTSAGASAYLHAQFVGPRTGDEALALIGLDDTSFELRPSFHTFQHYARNTEPGWIRVEAPSSSGSLLSSAWLSPEGTALSVVLVNSGAAAHDVKLTVPAEFTARLATARVTRTVFDGVERSAELGPVPEDRVVRVPARSIVTVALAED